MTVIGLQAAAASAPTPPGEWEAWAWAAATLAGALAAGLVAHFVLSRLLRRLARHTRWRSDDVLFEQLARPMRLLFPLFAVRLVMPALEPVPAEWRAPLAHAITVGLIAGVTWLTIAIVLALERIVLARHDIHAKDNLEARRVYTQITVISRTIQILALFVALAVALMTFPRVRELGHQPAGLGRDRGAGARPRGAARAREPDRRPAARPHPADPHRRRGHRRGRVGPYRGDHRAPTSW